MSDPDGGQDPPALPDLRPAAAHVQTRLLEVILSRRPYTALERLGVELAAVVLADEAIRAVTEFLAGHGGGQEAAPVSDQTQAEQLARWLAEQTGHPRFVGQPDGWRRLLEPGSNIDFAVAKAVESAGGVVAAPAKLVADLRNAAEWLRAHIAGRHSTPVRPGSGPAVCTHGDGVDTPDISGGPA